jgi:hypothetical protein
VLKENSGTIKEILVSGHSLGGGLATIFTKGIHEEFEEVHKTKEIGLSGYTFGAYSIGDDTFKADFDKKIPSFFRMVNDRDLIPHFQSPLMGYRHVGILCHMTDKDLFFDMEPVHVDIGYKEDDENASILDDMSALASQQSERLSDHACSGYYGLISMYTAIVQMTDREEKAVEKAWQA